VKIAFILMSLKSLATCERNLMGNTGTIEVVKNDTDTMEKVWLADIRIIYNKMAMEYREFLHKEMLAGRSVPVDEREDHLQVLKFRASEDAEIVGMKRIRAIPREDLPLYMNTDWGWEDCKQLFQDRLSGVKP
jgi:hypothetical protein